MKVFAMRGQKIQIFSKKTEFSSTTKERGVLAGCLVVAAALQLSACSSSESTKTETSTRVATEVGGTVEGKKPYIEVPSPPQGGSGMGSSREPEKKEDEDLGADTRTQRSSSPGATESGSTSEATSSATSSDKPAVTDSGRMIEEKREAGPFSRIENNSSANVSIEVGPNARVIVKADANIAPLIKTKVSGAILTVYSTEAFRTTKPMAVSVVAPHLNAIALAGSGNVSAAGLSEDKLEVNTSGAGSVTVSGIVKDLDLTISGAGSANLTGLMAENAFIEISGSGDAKVFCTDNLNATINGSGNVSYKGDPEIHPRLNGSGQIRPAKNLENWKAPTEGVR